MSFLINKKAAVFRLQKKLFNSRFFTISVLLHFILILSFGGTVLFNKYSEPQDFTGDPGSGFVGKETTDTPPPVQKPLDTKPTFTVTAPTSAAKSLDAITTSAPTQVAFTMPQIAAPMIAPTTDATKMAAPTAPTMSTLTLGQAKDIAAFTNGWVKNRKTDGGPGSSPRKREFEFTAYLAKYGDPTDAKRGGDWASTNWIAKEGGVDTIWGGSLPNLLYFMNKLSGGKIHALPQAVPLDLSSEDIYIKKPPFIFFTGHSNFVLTDLEVANLQKYVRVGGCIWGDSSLPGHRSRFDIAFRREMRRVISDVNKDWEEIPLTHPMFSKNLYYQEIKSPPAGMNFYKESVYALKFADQIAVIYTANDYGDMWQIGLTDKGQFDMSRDDKGRLIAMNFQMLQRSDTYYRNLSLLSVNNSYKFGTNVVIHLLTRWEDALRSVPTGL